MSPLSQIKLSMLDLAPIVEGGDAAQALSHSVQLAQHVEKLGFTRFWVAEHHNMPGVASSATAVLIGHIAAHTRNIRVGSGGIMLPNHAPLVVAEQFGTLATLFPGRIDLGLGRAPGTDPLTARALRRDRMNGDDFPQQVGELRGYLAPEQPGQAVRAIPGGGTEVPVWLLGSSLFSAQLAAQLGLPFAFAAHFAPTHLDEALQLYRHRFQPSAVLERPYAIACIPLIAADSDERAQQLATTPMQKFLALIRGQRLPLKPPVESMAGLWTPREEFTVRNEWLGEAIIGGPQQVRAALERFVERTGVDEIMLSTDCHSISDRLRSCEIAAELAHGKRLDRQAEATPAR
ncbi:LLM class flavin-dependent oxidoreductase [Chromobacterium sp. IIBBL 290-4]|uniref:LLM class flavin-dependent oxidoreductase n=1 Tax=Chromobacterium sp. IIBBL 290-4 TaxID=2953890 RepID=UPI0020B68487|nr:LLM class flavin-dependent oxidoreductase [Chromobacterium sp. IIBBL 290-4]UTH72610.1 LLM class flavin-dependent oxidoreductase [Chromobacterium sp. IIBBL 290-4]